MIFREEERAIERLFDDARRADEASAPSFREVLTRPRRRKAQRQGRLWRPALVALMVLLAAAALQVSRGSRRKAPEPELPAVTAAIVSWKAPTDVFLQTPGSDLLNRSADLASAIRIEDLALAQRKGAPR